MDQRRPNVEGEHFIGHEPAQLPEEPSHGIVADEELLAAQAAADAAVAQQQEHGTPGGVFNNVGQGLVGKNRDMMMQYWQDIINLIEHDEHDFKNHQLPLARIKKVMKTDEDVRMISAEAPILFAKGCDVFITELTMRAWIHAEENKRRTLQKSDIAAALTKSDMFDFLIDVVPREEERPKKTYRDPTYSPLLLHHSMRQGMGQHGPSDQNIHNVQNPHLPNAAPSSFPPALPEPMPNSMPNPLSNHMPNTMPSSMPSSLPNSLPSSMPSSMPNPMPNSMLNSMPGSTPHSVQTQMQNPMQNPMQSSLQNHLHDRLLESQVHEGPRPLAMLEQPMLHLHGQPHTLEHDKIGTGGESQQTHQLPFADGAVHRRMSDASENLGQHPNDTTDPDSRSESNLRKTLEAGQKDGAYFESYQPYENEY